MKICPNCKKKYFDDEGSYCFKCNYPLKHIEGTNTDNRENILSSHKVENENSYDTSIIKCPTCGSKKIKRLNIIDRGLSVGLFGLTSNKINKSFECRNCKYTW